MVNVITDNIDIWTAAQTAKTNGRGRGPDNQSLHGIKKLRELILELAIRGKLVPQDPKDEPASVLLEKIASEKARLVKEGKIKIQEPLPEINEEEKTFELPNGWAWVRLGFLSEIKGGKRLPTGHSFSTIKTPYIYIQVTNMKAGGISRDNLKYITERTHSEISRYTISKDDLYITIAGTIGDVGIVPEYFDGMNLTENAAKIVISEIDKSWLQKTLSSERLQQQFTDKTNQLAQPKLALHRIASSCLALPPLAEQHRIVAKVDELMVLCDQLEQQQTDSNAVHQTLVETLLGTLTRAADHDDFARAWHSIDEHFDTLFTTEYSIDQLKQTVLQLAVMGKLVPQDPNDEPASVLLGKIAREKARLIKERKIKKQNPLPEIGENEKPFELPNGWEWARLTALYYSISPSGKKLKSSEIIEAGEFPVVDQGKSYIAGYTNNAELLIEIPNPIIVFGDHTTERKYIDFNFVAGADGTKILCPYKMDERFFYTYLLSYKIESRGYARHFKILNDNLLALPPLSEQHRIVAKVDDLMAICETLKARLNDAQTSQVQLADAIVEQAVA